MTGFEIILLVFVIISGFIGLIVVLEKGRFRAKIGDGGAEIEASVDPNQLDNPEGKDNALDR